MKQLVAAIKSARWFEVFIVLAVLAVLLVLGMSGNEATGGSETERRMERILSDIEGAGQVTVMLSEDESGSCTGAVVASSGADDIYVMLRLQRAVQTLTGLESGNIEIVKSGR